VDYSPVYLGMKYVVVDGIFLHQIIDYLEIGKSEYIRDPALFAWCLMEEAQSYNPLSRDAEDSKAALLVLRTLHLLLLRYVIQYLARHQSLTPSP
jgi:hypothetical protein